MTLISNCKVCPTGTEQHGPGLAPIDTAAYRFRAPGAAEHLQADSRFNAPEPRALPLDHEHCQTAIDGQDAPQAQHFCL